MFKMIDLAERGWLPDRFIRFGIRRLLAERLRMGNRPTWKDRDRSIDEFAKELRLRPVAVETLAANEQHYEAPTGLFEAMLGPNMKYSGCYFPNGTHSLEMAENMMLELTAERSEIQDGMKILDLGCGWGSFSLWASRRFPNATLLAISNSKTQKQKIEREIHERGIQNLKVQTANVAEFHSEERFDRVVSIEMFEHMQNYELLLSKIRSWLSAQGKLFVHVFSHQSLAYPFLTEGASNWLGRHFFTGGLMPSHDLLLKFDRDFECEANWRIDGTHYRKTSDAWLENLDRHRRHVMEVIADAGDSDPGLQYRRWRIFLMCCSELFGYRNGEEWGISHYRFRVRH